MTSYIEQLGTLLRSTDADPELVEAVHAAYLEALGADLFGGTTPLSALPYPNPTDPVAAGADAIRALATALDAPVRNLDQYLILNGTTTVTLGAAAWSSISWPTIEKQRGTDVTQSGNGFVCAQTAVYVISVMINWSTAVSGPVTVGIGPSAGSGPDLMYRSTMPAPNGGVSQTATWERPATAGTALSLFVMQNGTGNQSIANRRLSIRRAANYS